MSSLGGNVKKHHQRTSTDTNPDISPRITKISDPNPSLDISTLLNHSSGSTRFPEQFPSNSHHGKVAAAHLNYSNASILNRGHLKGRSPITTHTMDPFEVRIRFTQHLQHLNASVTSANKAAQYALKYRDMDEDLHSCILEQLEKNTMNTRANIMYFIEHLCDLASREHHAAYIRMIERDILRVVDAVAPEDGSGAANVKVVRKVLNALSDKSFITAQTVSELEEYLKERDTQADAVSLSSPVDRDVDVTMMDTSAATYTPSRPGGGSKTNGYPNQQNQQQLQQQQRFDKRQAEQRIEEDRERHKRLRETIWAVPNLSTSSNTANKTPQEIADLDLEFDKLLEETSDLGDDDYDLYKEEAEERRFAAGDWREEYRARALGVGSGFGFE